jgi:hypothetical protein
MANLTFAVLGMIAVGGGAFGVAWGLKRRGPYELITETPTSKILSLREPGLVELKGAVKRLDRTDLGGTGRGDAEATFRSPLGGREDAVLAAWKVEEWNERGDHSSWQTIASGVWSVPFVLDDGTGELVVDVGDHADSAGLLSGSWNPKASDGVSFGGVMCEFSRFPAVRKLGAEEPTPDDVARFVASSRAIDPQTGSITNVVDIGNKHGDRRYYEASIVAGQDVYVLGHAYPRFRDAAAPLRPEQLVVTEPRRDDEGMLIVSDERERDLVRQTRYHRYGLALGGLGVVVGAALILAALGVV